MMALVTQSVESEEEWVALMRQSSTTGERVFIKFTATWCKPCKAIAPVYKDLSSGPGIFADLDVDEVSEVYDAEASGAGLPCFQVYEGKTRLAQMEGADAGKLKAFVDKWRVV